MNGEINEGGNPIAKLAEFQREQSVTSAANATPLPGALRNAFSPTPDIIVGPYKVRPVFDRDFEYLQALDHPIYRQSRDGSGKDYTAEMIQGKAARELCFIFTRPFKVIKELIKARGVAGVTEDANDEFEEFQLLEILEISKAVFRQLEIYWEPVIPFKATNTEGGDESKKNILAAGMDKLTTDSDSSLKNVA